MTFWIKIAYEQIEMQIEIQYNKKKKETTTGDLHKRQIKTRQNEWLQ